MALRLATLADLTTLVNIAVAARPSLSAAEAREYLTKLLTAADTYTALDTRGGFLTLNYDRDGAQIVRLIIMAIDPVAIPSTTTRKAAYLALLKAVVTRLLTLLPGTTPVSVSDELGGLRDTTFAAVFVRKLINLRGTPNETGGHNDLVQMSATLAQLNSLL